VADYFNQLDEDNKRLVTWQLDLSGTVDPFEFRRGLPALPFDGIAHMSSGNADWCSRQ